MRKSRALLGVAASAVSCIVEHVRPPRLLVSPHEGDVGAALKSNGLAKLKELGATP